MSDPSKPMEKDFFLEFWDRVLLNNVFMFLVFFSYYLLYNEFHFTSFVYIFIATAVIHSRLKSEILSKIVELIPFVKKKKNSCVERKMRKMDRTEN